MGRGPYRRVRAPTRVQPTRGDPSMSIAIKARWKKDAESLNGLNAIEEDLRANPTGTWQALVTYGIARTGQDWEDGGSARTTVKTIQIEPILDPDDQLTVKSMMERMHRDRTGQGTLFDHEKQADSSVGAEPNDDDEEMASATQPDPPPVPADLFQE